MAPAEAMEDDPDCNESFDDIMSKLGATTRLVPSSSAPSLPSGAGMCGKSSSSGVSSCSGRTRIHPRPFGCARAVGGLFSESGNLPQKDLTPWQQLKAASPERSWPTSSNDCVVQSPSRLLPPSSLSAHSTATSWKSEDERRSPPKSLSAMSSPSLRGAEVAGTSVERRTGVSPASSSRHARERKTPPVSPGQDKPPAQQGAWTQIVDDDVLQEEVMARLQERRRRLIGQLSRTERQMLEVNGPVLRIQKFGSAGSQRAVSAGGPFAGPRGMHRRTNAERWVRSRNDVARDTYNYLGPGTDGDPGPEIHPLWA